MDIPIQVDLGRIAQDLQIRKVQVESVVQLFNEGNTVPFITRYRKEQTGNLDEEQIRSVLARVTALRQKVEADEAGQFVGQQNQLRGTLKDSRDGLPRLQARIKLANNSRTMSRTAR